MMKFFYSRGTASFAAHVMLYECGCAFEEIHVSIKDGSMQKP